MYKHKIVVSEFFCGKYVGAALYLFTNEFVQCHITSYVSYSSFLIDGNVHTAICVVKCKKLTIQIGACRYSILDRHPRIRDTIELLHTARNRINMRLQARRM